MIRPGSDARYSRNYGFWSEAEQKALNAAHVAIAGVGGDGFQLGLKLARMGVGHFSIADPETFEPENTNRVEGAAASTYGRKKADVFAERLADINPAATLSLFREGVTPDNVTEFMHAADVVFDESELTRPEIGTLLARHARSRGIPDILVMNVGFAAQVTSFAPRSAWTFERFMGLDEQAPLDEIAHSAVDLSRCVPYVPRYTDLRTLATVQAGAMPGGNSVPLPSISIGVDIASALGSTQAFLHLTGSAGNRRRSPVWAPRVAYMDAYGLRARIVRAGRGTHRRHVLFAAIRQRMGRNPLASYTDEDIRRRS